MAGSLPVAWIDLSGGRAGDELGPYPGLELIPGSASALSALGREHVGVRAALLDFDAAAPAGAATALRSVLTSFPVPAIVRVPPGHVDEILPVLRAGDDVCLRGDAPALVAHRVRRLLASHDLDPLTQLLNRRAFYSRLEEILRTAAPDATVSVLFLDFDHFKRVNVEHGYLTADRVLESCAALLRHGDSVLAARIAGDEFAVIAPGLDEAAAVLFAARLCETLAAHRGPEGINVTASIGAATADGQELSATALVEQAATALYAAKTNGRNCAVHFRALEREAARAGRDVQVRALEAIQRLASDRAAQAILLRSQEVIAALQKRADQDGLTGLYNRGYLERRLPRSFRDARGGAVPLSVALIDVDHFGAINKTLGWPTGDQALRDVADIIRRAVRAEDWVARYGGEEIAVVLNGTTRDEAASVAERIRVAVERHAFRATNGEALAVTVSIGVAELQPGETLLQLWDRLSSKLLAAKNEGRNRVRS